MKAQALAGVLEAIAHAIRVLPTEAESALSGLVARPAPPPPPSPPTAAWFVPAPAQAPQPVPPASLEDPAPAPVAEPQVPVAEPSADTVSSWLATYRTIIADRGYKEQTLKNRGACIKFIEQCLGSRPLRAIKPHEITTMLKRCSPQGGPRAIRVARCVR